MALLLFASGHLAFGQVILTKADSTTTLDQAGSWVENAVPDANTVGVWDGTLTSSFYSSMGNGTVLGGITILDPAQAISLYAGNTTVTMNGTSVSTHTIGNGTLTLGNTSIPLSINMTNASANLTIVSAITLANTQIWSIAANRTLTASGNIAGAGLGITKDGAGTLILSGSVNTYTGDTVVANGTLQLGTGVFTGGNLAGNVVLSGGNLVLASTSSFIFGNSTIAGMVSGSGSVTKINAGLAILIGGASYTGGTTISGGTLQIGDGNTTGILTGNVLDNANLTIAPGANAALFQSGSISGNGTFTKGGTATSTWVMGMANFYTGRTLVSAGTLLLDFSSPDAPATDIIASASNLTMSNGTLYLKGDDTVASVSQTFNGTRFDAGASAIVMDPNQSSALTLNLKTMLRNEGSTLDITLPQGANITTASAGLIGGIWIWSGTIIGSKAAFATIGGIDWATVSGNVIGPLSGYQTSSDPALWSGNNVSLAGDASGVLGNLTVNSLRFTDSANITIAAASNLTINTGGILVTANNTGVDSISGGKIRSGYASNPEIVVIQNDTAHPFTISSEIVDNNNSNELTKSGAGTLILNHDNSFTGSTIINAGTLQLGDGVTNGNVGGQISNHANLTFFTNGTMQSFFKSISGDGLLTKTGPGTLILADAEFPSSIGGAIVNGYNGTVQVDGGTLQLGNGTALSTIAGNITNNADLIFNISATGEGFGGVISGIGNVTKLGPGVLTLINPQSYSGLTVVSSGTLQIGNSTKSAAINGNIVNDADLIFAGATTPQSFSGVISGTGNLAINRNVTLTAANTYTGETRVSGDLTLDFSAVGAPSANIISGSSALILTSGNFAITGHAGAANGQAFNGVTITSGANRIIGTSAAAGTVNLALGNLTRETGVTLELYLPAAGQMSASFMPDGIVRSGPTAFASIGGTDWATVNGGILLPYSSYQTDSNPGAWQPTDDVSISSNVTVDTVAIDTLKMASDLAPVNLGIGGVLTLEAGGLLAVGNSTLSLDGGQVTAGAGNELVILPSANSTLTIGSDLSDNGQPVTLTKAGAGTLVLSGANSLTGNTNLNDGVLEFADSAALQHSILNLNDGSVSFGALTDVSVRGLAGSDSALLSNAVGDAVTLTINDLAEDDVIYSGLISGAGTLVKSGAGTLNMMGGLFNTGGLILNSGRLVLGPGSGTVVGPLTINGGTVESGWSGSTFTTSTFKRWNINGNFSFTAAGVYGLIGTQVVLGADSAINVEVGTLSISGNVSGNFGIVKTGAGALQLGGNNTFTGGVRIDEGTFILSSNPGAGTASITFNGGTLKLGSNFIVTAGTPVFNGTLFIPLIVSKNGTLGVDIGGGSPPVVVGAADGSITGNATLTIDLTNTVHGVSGAYMSIGNGTANGLSAFNGTLAVLPVASFFQNYLVLGTNTTAPGNYGNSQFTLNMGNANIIFAPAAPGSTVTLGALMSSGTSPVLSSNTTGGAFLPNKTTTYVVGGNNLSTTYYGSIVDGFSAINLRTALVKTGTGTLVLSGCNTYTGGTTISGGILQFGNAALNPILNPAFGNNIVDNANLVLALNSTAYTFTGTISGSGNLALTGSAAANLTLSAANTFSGSTVINMGTLRLGGNLSLQNSTLSYTIGGGQFSFGALTNATLGGLAGDKDLSLANASAGNVALKVGQNGFASGYSGTLSGGGALTKIGAGALTLAGANTYTGGTVVSAGTLVVTNNGTVSATGSGNVTIQTGAMLEGTGGVAGNTTVAGSLAPGISGNAGLLVFSHNLTFNSSASVGFDLGGLARGTQYDALNIAGNLAMKGTLSVFLFNGFTPAEGSDFDLFQIGGVLSGVFATITLPYLNNNLGWDLSNLYTTGDISTQAITYNLWVTMLGLTGPSAQPQARPFGDGLPNLVRYAMNLDSTPPGSQLPTSDRALIGGVVYLTLQYRVRKDLTDYRLVPQSCTDLQNWTNVPAEDITPLPDDDDFTARYEARVAVPAQGRAFLRLIVQASPAG